MKGTVTHVATFNAMIGAPHMVRAGLSMVTGRSAKAFIHRHFQSIPTPARPKYGSVHAFSFNTI
jgi:hypothetical protein